MISTYPARTAVALLPLLLVGVLFDEEGFVRPLLLLLALALLLLLLPLLLMMVVIQTNDTQRKTLFLLFVCLFVGLVIGSSPVGFFHRGQPHTHTKQEPLEPTK